MSASQESPKRGLLERGVNWDEQFNRRLGIIATVAAGGLAFAGLPVAATCAAIFAGGNFATAEIERRVGLTLTTRRIGKVATNH